MLQAPPTILEQVMAIRGFIIQFPMSSLFHVGENSFFCRCGNGSIWHIAATISTAVWRRFTAADNGVRSVNRISTI